MNSKALNMLGLARRANKIALGHDAALEALRKGGARLILTSADASKRLCEEFDALCKQKNVVFIQADCTMNELGAALGAKTTAVLAVSDDGFAGRITELIREDD